MRLKDCLLRPVPIMHPAPRCLAICTASFPATPVAPLISTVSPCFISTPHLSGKSDVKAAEGRRSEEHTSELQSRFELVCCLLLEKKTNRGTASRPTYVT